MNNSKTQFIVKVAVLGALATILMYFDFPLPIAPPFYKIDLADTAALIGGFALGPLAAAAITLVKNLLILVIKGTQTAYIGELANFLTSCAFTCTAAFVYKANRTKKGAIIGLIAGVLALAIAGGFINYYVVIPAYVKFMHLPLEVIVGMGTAIYSSVNSLLTLVLLCTVPFNLVKGVIIGIITSVLYKRISPLLKLK